MTRNKGNKTMTKFDAALAAYALNLVNDLLGQCLAVYNERRRADWAMFEPTLLDLAVARNRLKQGNRQGALTAIADARACLRGDWGHFRA